MLFVNYILGNRNFALFLDIHMYKTYSWTHDTSQAIIDKLFLYGITGTHSMQTLRWLLKFHL